MPMRALGRAARAARHLPERLLHGSRRRALLKRLARLAPRSILFACHGNICRSPFAAAVARSLLPASVRITSGGIVGPGRAAPSAAVSAARERGFDLAAHRARLLTRQDLEGADLVVVMDRDQQRAIGGTVPKVAERVILLGDLDPVPITRRSIHDPVDQADDVFRASYARIERCVRVLAAAILGEAGADDAGR